MTTALFFSHDTERRTKNNFSSPLFLLHFYSSSTLTISQFNSAPPTSFIYCLHSNTAYPLYFPLRHLFLCANFHPILQLMHFYILNLNFAFFHNFYFFVSLFLRSPLGFRVPASLSLDSEPVLLHIF